MSAIKRVLLAPASNALLYWLLVGFNVLDFLMTTLILQHGGSEANPYVLYFILMFGPIGMLIAKIPPLVILGVMLFRYWYDLRYKWKVALRRTLITLNLLFGLLTIYSSAVLYAVV